ncbi:hypothetical protein Bca4012_055403 [Brassica carinata]
MTKKKKAKHGLSGRGASASPSSSSSNQSPGVNKQASSKTPAIPPSLKLDLAAAVSDGSVDLPSDLPLESRATVETSTDVLGLSEIEAPTDVIKLPETEANKSPVLPVIAIDGGSPDSPTLSAKAATVADPVQQTSFPPLASTKEPAAANQQAPPGHLPALDKGKGIDYPAVPPVKTPAKVYRPKSTDHTDTAETSKAPDPVTASEVESDSSDIQTSESDAEEGQYIPGFVCVD